MLYPEELKKEPEEILGKYRLMVENMEVMRPMGRVVQVSGMSILTEGPPDVPIGEICRIQRSDKTGHVLAEVVGFQGHKLIMMPLGATTGIFPEADVLATGKQLTLSCSESMLGRILDGTARPLDNKPPLLSKEQFPADREPPGPVERSPIKRPLETGVRAIDSMLTIGQGQRVGIFAGTGVGKSTLLGMIARYCEADVNIICLVGERGREVRDFLENDLGEEGLQKSVVFVATSDRSAAEKVNVAGFALSAAEYFRDRGKTVNLLMDSLTRYAMALREIGIASGDQLGPGGYPPGVWFKMARLVERSGATGKGSITGFYSVLVEGDDMNDPVADNARGILDGHIVLSRRLAQKGHYPSIEITESISRVMDRVITEEHRENAQTLRAWLAAHRESEDLINLGAYARGSNPDVDQALDKMPEINALLRQRVADGTHLPRSVERLAKIISPAEEEFY